MKNAPTKSHNLDAAPNSPPLPCVWMQAGVVGFKLCDREFDCEHCPFDQAIGEGAHSQTQIANGDSATLTAHPPSLATMHHRQEEVTNLDGYDVAGSLFYHPGHVWARIEDEGRVRIGLDDFGQQLTGRIYAITLPAIGASVDDTAACWAVTHQAGETTLVAPVSGIVQQLNTKLTEQPSLVNRDPYGEGWAMVIQPTQLDQSLKQLYYGQSATHWFAQTIADMYQNLNAMLAGDIPGIGATLPDGGIPIKDATRLLEADQIKRLIDSCFSHPIHRQPSQTEAAMMNRNQGR